MSGRATQSAAVLELGPTLQNRPQSLLLLPSPSWLGEQSLAESQEEKKSKQREHKQKA